MSPCVQQNLHVVYNFLCKCKFSFWTPYKIGKVGEEKVTKGDMSHTPTLWPQLEYRKS